MWDLGQNGCYQRPNCSTIIPPPKKKKTRTTPPHYYTVLSDWSKDRGWPFGRPFLFGKTPPKDAAYPRDCPCRPRASSPPTKRLGSGFGFGFVFGLGSGWVWADARNKSGPKVLHERFCKTVFAIRGTLVLLVERRNAYIPGYLASGTMYLARTSSTYMP